MDDPKLTGDLRVGGLMLRKGVALSTVQLAIERALEDARTAGKLDMMERARARNALDDALSDLGSNPN